MSDKKRKLEQDFKRLSELCLELDAEKNDLKAKYEKAVEALKTIGVCICDARLSGENDEEYRARGCPSCTCKPDWKIAFDVLRELGEKE